VRGGLLCGQIALEGVADLPLVVGGTGFLLACVGHLEGGVAGTIEPEEEAGEEVVGEGEGVDGGVLEGVVDEGVLLEEGVREGGDLVLLDLPVPLLQDVDEEVKLVVRGEQRVSVELPQLEGRVLLSQE
jgi:hypothetical protein